MLPGISWGMGRGGHQFEYRCPQNRPFRNLPWFEVLHRWDVIFFLFKKMLTPVLQGSEKTIPSFKFWRSFCVTES